MGVMFKSAAEQRLFLSMIVRMADYSGFIRIDGIEVQNIGLQKLREKIFVISQVSVQWCVCVCVGGVNLCVCVCVHLFVCMCGGGGGGGGWVGVCVCVCA